MGVVIRRWVWLETIGVVSGCFPHITYISLLHLYLFFFAAAYIFVSMGSPFGPAWAPVNAQRANVRPAE